MPNFGWEAMPEKGARPPPLPTPPQPWGVKNGGGGGVGRGGVERPFPAKHRSIFFFFFATEAEG